MPTVRIVAIFCDKSFALAHFMYARLPSFHGKIKFIHCSSADTPDASRKLAVSTQSLASGTTGSSQGGAPPLSQRKRLLKAPTLAELDSSESDVRCGTCGTVNVSFVFICKIFNFVEVELQSPFDRREPEGFLAAVIRAANCGCALTDRRTGHGAAGMTRHLSP